MHTYGLFSVGTGTFNLEYNGDYWVKNPFARNTLVTLLRIHNCALDILGYIPGVSFYSGHVRMATGLAMCAIAQFHINNNENPLVEEFYWETLNTGVAQIARGALEAYVQHGRAINAFLDLSATIYNVYSKHNFKKDDYVDQKNPVYPLPFRFLYLV